MKFLSKLKSGWLKLDTAGKIGIVLDIICGVGSMSIGSISGNKLSEGRNRIERICIKTTTAGMALAAGDIASKALKENYGGCVAEIIDKVKAKAKASEKEAKADE